MNDPASSDALLQVLVWIAIAATLAVLSGTVAAWLAYVRARRIEERLGLLQSLERIDAALARFSESHAELDLRRLEHVLIDLRDGQRRVEERLLAVVEAAHSGALARESHTGAFAQGPGEAAGTPGREGVPALPAPPGAAARSTAGALAERAVTRLLALGYERIGIVTPEAELAALSDADGEILVEARRDGAPCKGRVLLRGGRIADVQMQAAYSIFP
jgi:hypothetical protein